MIRSRPEFMRDEPRRVLDAVNASARQVTLRLLFDDARHPDFSLDLWLPADRYPRGAISAAAAIREARGWLARAEAIMRRAQAPMTPAPEPEVETYEPELEPEFELETDNAPARDVLPWEDDELDGGEAPEDEPDEGAGQPRLL